MSRYKIRKLEMWPVATLIVFSGRLRGRSRKLRCSAPIPVMAQTTAIDVCRRWKTTMALYLCNSAEMKSEGFQRAGQDRGAYLFLEKADNRCNEGVLKVTLKSPRGGLRIHLICALDMRTDGEIARYVTSKKYKPKQNSSCLMLFLS